ncbi:thioredoxin-like protein [Clohesyomyces aquaticus]|uniref:thioredoxin-dependent peroxiredoxin n=1 Tax=Clohesyomyces aquaticus TaxID=1231657 RepID=A0A1Y1ZPX2_9PLEO|nr:thioredoxin-like protein [Clohesyomyces aquaticus]
MVELRKRKTPPPAPAARVTKKKAAPKAEKTKVGKAKAIVAEKMEEVKEAVTGKANGAKAAAPASGPPKVGDTVDLAEFGGEIETHEGTKTTLAKLVEESTGGVVLFTYPKASTPGCTTQACNFRDNYESFGPTGYSIYGLSTDSPKANTTFKTKQTLPYTMLCDPSQTLISAIGLAKAGKKTERGVFVIDKSGKVLAAQGASPANSVPVVKKAIGASDSAPAAEASAEKKDVEMAETAGQVADTAAKIDSNEA